MRVLWLIGLVGCLPGEKGPAGDEAESDDPCLATDGWDADLTALECEVLALTNARRAAGADCGSMGSYGPAAPLSFDAALREAARVHSTWMGESGHFSHESPDGPIGDDLPERVESTGYDRWELIGENIAAGPTTAEEVVNGWMGSDGHCSNIMEPDFEDLGVGLAVVRGTWFWTQDFGTSF